MYQEYDVIRTVGKLSLDIPKGTIGTILIVYDTLPKRYEVEFVDSNLEHIQVLTVNERDIELVKKT